MSAFSQDWLEQREPIDRAARNKRVLDACARYFSGRGEISVCDLGAGTGATLRAIADRLPPCQRWTLLDRDAAHLAAARTALGRWAKEEAEDRPDGLILDRNRRRIAVRTRLCDLAQGCGAHLNGAGLATASALFDLVSENWIGSLVADLAALRMPIYAELTFDGTIRIEPPLRLDGIIVAAFLAHQRRDKGFGPAAGPDAHGALVHRLHSAGYALVEGPSPWRLTATEACFAQTVLDGLAAATAETGLASPNDVATWREDRRAQTNAVTISHRDLFAWPT